MQHHITCTGAYSTAGIVVGAIKRNRRGRVGWVLESSRREGKLSEKTFLLQTGIHMSTSFDDVGMAHNLLAAKKSRMYHRTDDAGFKSSAIRYIIHSACGAPSSSSAETMVAVHYRYGDFCPQQKHLPFPHKLDALQATSPCPRNPFVVHGAPYFVVPKLYSCIIRHYTQFEKQHRCCVTCF